MSQYLVFKKGEGPELCSFSRSSDVYQAFEHLSYSEDWRELSNEDFNIAIGALEVKKDAYEENIELYEKAMVGLSYEDKLVCLRDIQETKEELRWIAQAEHYIELLQMIADEYDFKGNKPKMYYCIG